MVWEEPGLAAGMLLGRLLGRRNCFKVRKFKFCRIRHIE